MTNLYFRHSVVYEQMLSKLDGTPYSEADMQKCQAHTLAFSKYWETYNDSVFTAFGKLGFSFAGFWIAYFVQPRDTMFPFSDPVTIFVNSDFDHTLSTIIHELVHVMMVYPDNELLTVKIMQGVAHRFPASSPAVQVEVPTAFISRMILTDVVGKEKADALQAHERNIPIVGEAWSLIDASPDLTIL